MELIVMRYKGYKGYFKESIRIRILMLIYGWQVQKSNRIHLDSAAKK